MQQQVEALMKDNTVLKRAVAIQHERQKALEDANQQLEFFKQLIPQYQEKVRNLEVSLKQTIDILLLYTDGCIAIYMLNIHILNLIFFFFFNEQYW